LEEKGMTVDEDLFTELMAEQRARARAARKDAGADAWKGNAGVAEQLTAGEFVGYSTLTTTANVTAIVCGEFLADTLHEGDSAVVVLDKTPFYGESGGQVGDCGVIEADGVRFEVTDTQKNAAGVYLHSGTLVSGELSVGTAVTATVCAENRAAIVRNHSAAHLLQAALRTVLGSHAEQAGQLVNAERVRFDFTHFSALTAEEIAKVEALVNQWILAGSGITVSEMPIEEARKQGAMALFGEKYGEVVRVVKMGDVSMELCGGTHADNTAKIGLFRILSETSVAAGVRRIEAVTGSGVLELLSSYREELLKAAETMKANGPDDVARRATQLQTELKDCQRELQTLRAGQAANRVKELFAGAVDVGGIQLVSARLQNVDGNELKTLCDSCKDFAPEKAVVVLAGVSEEKQNVTFVCYCTKGAVAAGANAGNVVRQVAAICGGKGGGKPDMAMAGGKDIAKVAEALAALPSILK
ncbi:MAG: alanine--tRNA ligase, partial [Clostridia bacterium]|nr:alanine--tRNA ligase [Clostridia bacterium]